MGFNGTQMKKVLVLYGSQTGNSEEVAERLCRKLSTLDWSVKAISVEDYDLTKIFSNSSIVVFICSTTGQGEFPESARKFWRVLLRKNLPPDCLDFLRFCVVGLGDSSYEKFNVAAKKLNKRLLQLGGKELLPLALCDDQHELGYDATFESWLKDFVNGVIGHSLSNLDKLDEILLPPKYHVRFLDSNTTGSVFTNPEHAIAKLEDNQRITNVDHFQAVHLIKFKIDKDVTYDPGDVVSLMPENDPENVDEFLQLLDMPLDTEFVLEPTDPEIPVPKNLPHPCTLRNCAISYFDIQSVPKRLFFDILWHFSKSDLEQEKLREFTTAEGQEELYSYCNRPRRNILEVLQDFPMTTPNISIDYLFDLLPCIRPRFFSIASSLSYNPCNLHVLVAQVKYKTRLAKPRMGLCSTWLSQLDAASEVAVPFSLKKGSIKLPEGKFPIIMVGPGTGVAPFRSFIQERISKGIKENYLFFGCRYKDKDFLCAEEWQHMIEEEWLTLHVAFSRDQDEKVYVQHKIAEEGSLLWDLIDGKNAYFYIAGNAKNMPTAVKDAVLSIFEKHGGMNSSESKDYLQRLENQKRFQTETWC